MAEVKTWKGFLILIALALVLALGAVAVPMAGTVEASPDEATFYSTASDGQLWFSSDTYTTAHDAASGNWLPNDPSNPLGQKIISTTYYIFRGGLFFDTASLPDDVPITSATLSLYGYYDYSDTDFDITVVDGSVLEDPMVGADYGDLKDQTTSGGTFDTSGFSTTGYNDIALNAAGISWISKTGTTKFGLRSSRDISATVPTGNEQVGIWANEEAESGERRPKLVVTYTTAPPPPEVWVDDTGPSCPAGTGNGTQADPYCMIQTGIDNVAPGGTVHVYPGKYHENLVINKSLTLQSVSGNWQDTIIDDVAILPEITISGDVDVTVQGFEITAGSYGIYVGTIECTVNILDCFIHGNLSDGIHVESACDQLNIERNIISENGIPGGGCGIYMKQAWNTTNIRDNIIGAWWDGEGTGATYTGNQNDGIDIDNVPVGTDVIIEGNHIVENGIMVSADHGINLDSVAGDVDIQDNVIGAWTYYYEGVGTHNFTGNKNHGIHVGPLSDTGTITIEGNAISENGNDGINFGDEVSPIYGTVTIVENIIGGWTCYPGDYGYSGDLQRYYGNGDRGIEINQVGESGASGTVTIEGNKISENHTGAIDLTGIYIQNIYAVVTIEDNDIGSWTDRYGTSYLGNNGAGIVIVNVFSGAELTIGPDNSIKNNIGDGIDILWGEPDASIEIHHNTIDNNDLNGIQFGMPYGVDRFIVNHDAIDNNSSNGIQVGPRGEVDGATINHNTVINNDIGIYLAGPSDQNIISDNQIRNNEDGIVVEGNDNQILRNNILNNQGGVWSGIHIVSFHSYPVSGNVIHCNNIVGNFPHGVSCEIIYNDLHDGMYNQNGDEAVDATGNWWGCIEGPGAAGCDTLFGNVLYDPWLLDQFQYCEECGGARRPSPGVPTVNHWGTVAMITVFAGLLVWAVRRRRLVS